MKTPSDYGLPHEEFRVYQQESVDWVLALNDNDRPIGIIQAPTGCHRAGQLILMWDGYLKKAEDIAIGDFLMGPDSQPRTVLNLIHGQGEMYKIKPVKGQPFAVNGDHILTLVRTNTRRRGKKIRSDCLDGEIVDVTVNEYLSWAKSRKHIYKLFRVPVNFPLSAHYRLLGLGIEPYFLGVLLGDGSIRRDGSMGVTTMDREIVNEIYRQAKIFGLKIRVVEGGNGKAKTYYFHAPIRGMGHSMLRYLAHYQLRGCTSGTKFVPHEYKIASRGDRLDLLAGILDTDGHLSHGYYDYVSKSRRLADDVSFIARSVGFAAYVSQCHKTDQCGRGGIYHRVSISGEISKIPCHIPYKQAAPRRQKKSVLRTGLFITNTETTEDFFGFVLDGDGRYLLNDFTVTHNSGKSTFAKSAAHHYGATSLCRTKALQRNYGHLYNFDLLFGRRNYPCINENAHNGATAGECLFSEKGMYHCPDAPQCPYLVQKAIVKASGCRSLNYFYWLVAKWPRSEDYKTDYLVLDECHELPALVTDWAGTYVSEASRREWELPEFPTIRNTLGLLHKPKNYANPYHVAIEWFANARQELRSQYTYLSQRTNDEKHRRRARQCESFGLKIAATLGALRDSPLDWFIKSGPTAGRDKNGRSCPAIVTKPLTARHHFKGQFASQTMILMSATIGNFDALAEELGIPPSMYCTRDVPSIWPPESRPVYTFTNAPRLSHKSTDEDFALQADIIGKAILGCPSDWSGIIHVTRKTEATKLAGRLAHRGLQDRIVAMPQYPTDQQMIWWQNYKLRIPNAIVTSWAWTEGVDLGEEKICISAKAPFPHIGSDFERARMERSSKMFLQRTAWGLEQSLGRTRRGRPQDYDLDGDQRGFVAIVDGNWTRVRDYLSTALSEAIVETEFPL